MMRAIAIGDLHLGPGDRNDDRRRAIDQIIDENINDPTVIAWIMAGDISNSRMTIDDRNWLRARLERMASRAPVVGCYGNHDAPGDLDIFEHLEAEYPIRFASHPDVFRFQVPAAAQQGIGLPLVYATIAILPYPDKASLVAAGVAKAEVAAAGLDPLLAICRSLAVSLDDARARGDVTLCIGHINVAGALIGVGQPNHGIELELTGEHLAVFGPAPIIVNHIHVGQEIHGAVYPGSVCRLAWGETHPKRYLVVEYLAAQTPAIVGVGDARNGGLTDLAADGPPVWTWTISPRPLTVAPMFHVEGDLTREGFTWRIVRGTDQSDLDATSPPARTCDACLAGVLHTPDHPCAICGGSGLASSWDGCDVRVRYRFARSESSVLDRATVAAHFPGARRLALEPIAIHDGDIRAPAVVAAKTLADKAAAWCDLEHETLTPAVLQKMARVEHGDPPQVLADVVREIQEIP